LPATRWGVPLHTSAGSEEERLPGLVTPEWLQSQLGEPDLQVLDIRGVVNKGSVGADGVQDFEYVALQGDYVDGQ
jgi:hypothetical protein